jgi:hypothetical protein
MVSCTRSLLLVLVSLLCLMKSSSGNGAFIARRAGFSLDEEIALFGVRSFRDDEKPTVIHARNGELGDGDNESARFALRYNEELQSLCESQSAYLRRNGKRFGPSLVVPV